MNQETKDVIEKYCLQIFNQHVDKNIFDNKFFLETYFLEQMFHRCVEKYEMNMKYELTLVELESIQENILIAEETFERFTSGELEVKIVNEKDTMIFDIPEKNQ